MATKDITYEGDKCPECGEGTVIGKVEDGNFFMVWKNEVDMWMKTTDIIDMNINEYKKRDEINSAKQMNEEIIEKNVKESITDEDIDSAVDNDVEEGSIELNDEEITDYGNTNWRPPTPSFE